MRREVIGKCELYLGDCFEILPEIGGADCVITDPPYGCTCNSWDRNIDLARFWELALASAKDGAVFCVFCQMPFAADLYHSNREMFRYEYVYVKPKLTGFLDARGMWEHRSDHVIAHSDIVLLVHDGISRGTWNEMQRTIKFGTPYIYERIPQDKTLAAIV